MPNAFVNGTDAPSCGFKSIVWILDNPLECDSLGLWCRTRLACDAVEMYTQLERGLARCRHICPSLLIVDPTMRDDAIVGSLEALRVHHAQHLLILDRRPLEGRLIQLLTEPNVSYLSRRCSPLSVASAIARILEDGTRAIDPAFASLVTRKNGILELEMARGSTSSATLSHRERQVIGLLATGHTSRQAAAILKLAVSTVDNHRTRIMKKLGIRKATELTRRALREGWINP